MGVLGFFLFFLFLIWLYDSYDSLTSARICMKARAFEWLWDIHGYPNLFCHLSFQTGISRGSLSFLSFLFRNQLLGSFPWSAVLAPAIWSWSPGLHKDCAVHVDVEMPNWHKLEPHGTVI